MKIKIIIIFIIFILILTLSYNATEKFTYFSDLNLKNNYTDSIYKNDDRNIIFNSDDWIHFQKNNTNILSLDIIHRGIKTNGISSMSGMDLTINQDDKTTTYINGSIQIIDNDKSYITKNASVSVGNTTTELKNGDMYIGGNLNVLGNISFFPDGMIALWPLDKEIPFGWVLCDGTNNTPDLRGRSIIGYDYASKPLYVDDKRNVGGSTEVTITLKHLENHTHDVEYTLKEEGHVHNINSSILYGRIGGNDVQAVIPGGNPDDPLYNGKTDKGPLFWKSKTAISHMHSFPMSTTSHTIYNNETTFNMPITDINITNKVYNPPDNIDDGRILSWGGKPFVDPFNDDLIPTSTPSLPTKADLVGKQMTEVINDTSYTMNFIDAQYNIVTQPPLLNTTSSTYKNEILGTPCNNMPPFVTLRYIMKRNPYNYN